MEGESDGERERSRAGRHRDAGSADEPMVVLMT